MCKDRMIWNSEHIWENAGRGNEKCEYISHIMKGPSLTAAFDFILKNVLNPL